MVPHVKRGAMSGRSHSVRHTTRASVSRVCGLLRHHPETAMLAILALAYPTPRSGPTRVLVGPVDESDDAGNVTLEWEIGGETPHSSHFSGDLEVTRGGEGAQLHLTGVVRGESNDATTLTRVLSWLALAAESGATSGGR